MTMGVQELLVRTGIAIADSERRTGFGELTEAQRQVWLRDAIDQDQATKKWDAFVADSLKALEENVRPT